MKYIVQIVSLLVIGFLVMGCHKPTDKDSKDHSDDVGAAGRDEAITATKDAARSVAAYAYAQKREFTAASWQDAQNRYQAARSDLKSSLDETRQWLSKRIEP